jgi:hypothetical protein
MTMHVLVSLKQSQQNKLEFGPQAILYRERLIETLERRERFCEPIMNCCVTALSEWLYMLNIAFTGILIQNIVKQML